MSTPKNINPIDILYGENKTQIDAAVRRYSVIALIIDFIILNISFITVYYLKTGGWEISQTYSSLLYTFYLSWLVISFAFKKFNLNKYANARKGAALLLRADLAFLYLIALIIVFARLHGYSRLQIFGTIAIFTFLEIAVFLLYYHFTGKKIIDALQSAAAVKKETKSKFSVFIFYD